MGKIKVQEAFQRVDLFSSNISLLKNGKQKQTSCFGAIISLSISVVVINYGMIKFDTLRTYGDTLHQTITKTRMENDI